MRVRGYHPFQTINPNMPDSDDITCIRKTQTYLEALRALAQDEKELKEVLLCNEARFLAQEPPRACARRK